MTATSLHLARRCSNDSMLGRSTDICQARIGAYCRLAALLFVLNAISALLFILFVNRMAYNDR
jgi:hypothetical protein